MIWGDGISAGLSGCKGLRLWLPESRPYFGSKIETFAGERADVGLICRHRRRRLHL